MDAKVYGSENKEAVVEIERMLRRDEHASRVVNDQAIRRKRERFAFGLTAFLAAAVVCGVLFLNAGKPGLAVRLHFANLLGWKMTPLKMMRTLQTLNLTIITPSQLTMKATSLR